MAGKVLTKNCKRCDAQFITTDSRKIFCGRTCASRYAAMERNVRKRERPDDYKDWERDYKFKKTYGISLEDYNQMFQEQEGSCAICGTHQVDLKKRLAVDHCHSSGRVRKLLCQKCNHGIGLFNDDPDLLQKAARYLLW